MRRHSRNEGRRHRTGVLLVLVVALIATACGARVAPFLGTNSVAQGGTSTQGDTTSGGATTTTAAGGIVGGTPGGTSGGSSGNG